MHFNQVGGKEFSELIDATWNSGYAKQVREQADQVQAASCNCFNYNFVTVPGGAGCCSTNSSGRARAANSPECGDCDLEVFFPAGTTTVRWISGAGLVYYTGVNGQFLYRKPSSNSKLLIGYGAVNSVFAGIEWFAQIAYKTDRLQDGLIAFYQTEEAD